MGKLKIITEIVYREEMKQVVKIQNSHGLKVNKVNKRRDRAGKSKNDRYI